MAEADPEDRHPPEQLLHRLAPRRGAARDRRDRSRGRRRRSSASSSASTAHGCTCTCAPAPCEPAQDRALAAVVDDRDADRALARVDVRRFRRHLRDERSAGHRRLGAHLGERLVARRGGGDGGGPHRPALAQAQNERARVDAGEPDDPVLGEPPVHSGPRASRMSTAFAWAPADSERAVGDAVVPDHRRGEADELLREARVGDRLLVAGHRGREDRLAERDALGAHRLAGEDRPVLERQVTVRCVAHPCTSRPSATVCRTRPRSFSPEQPGVGRARAEAFLASPSTPPRGRAGRGWRGRRPRASAPAGRTRAPGRPTSARAASRARSDPARRGACRGRRTPSRARSRRTAPPRTATSFSSRECGAWSVATHAIVPLRSASTSASRSLAVPSGGFIFVFGSSERTASSVRTRWCGVTSAVAATPRRLRPLERLDRGARPRGASDGAAAPRGPRARGRARPSRSPRARASRRVRARPRPRLRACARHARASAPRSGARAACP